MLFSGFHGLIRNLIFQKRGNGPPDPPNPTLCGTAGGKIKDKTNGLPAMKIMGFFLLYGGINFSPRHFSRVKASRKKTSFSFRCRNRPARDSSQLKEIQL